ncbi:hypothetical protein [Streptomyces cylindrosporus]|uniref:Uncharacterized protein n=1 Tax=Streptomyces cylindrosporus TaxID=2927583 RepID=A0ABS9YPC2_9ACTN|nr:hypothetical protein [Streptomyces cylindrosporus]MCI3279117.1 hypothetical protein [Streptomyces cylindrosporus]
MFRRDTDTGEEIAFRVTTPQGNTVISGYSEDFWRQTPGAEVEEVRGHSQPDGFVVERTVA